MLTLIDAELDMIQDACRKGAVEIRELRRQRDCLHKNFNLLADKFMLYVELPEELVKVLDEIEGEE